MKKDHLLTRLQLEGNPIIDGETVTFIWKGNSAPHLIDDLHGWDDHPKRLKRFAPDLWTISFNLKADAYLEYSFYEPETQTRLKDPFNKHRIYNGVGGYNNFFYMPNAAPSPLIKPAEKKFRGTVTRHKIGMWMLSLRSQRTVYLYRPPAPGPAPLLIVYDGPDYLRRGRINIIVDNLIAQKRIRPIAMALLQNGGREQRRFAEYACSDGTLSWLRHDVLPLAQQKLKLTDERGAFGVLGASMGGLMAMYTGLRMPKTFGKIASQAGVFWFEGLPTSAVELIENKPRPDVKIWMDAGRMDFLLEDNRRIQPILQEKGYNVTYYEGGGAHNYTSWRNNLGNALETIFG